MKRDLSALEKRLGVRLACDDIVLTMLGYEGDPKQGYSFDDRAAALTVTALWSSF
jgi:hypothetical protein